MPLSSDLFALTVSLHARLPRVRAVDIAEADAQAAGQGGIQVPALSLITV